jgi:hypothetical protein
MTRISRRQLLAGAGLAGAGIVAAAGVGSGVAALTRLPQRANPANGVGKDRPGVASPAAPSGAAPAELLALLDREQALLNSIAAALSANPANAVTATSVPAPVLTALQADHRAHVTAVIAAIAESGASSPSPATPTVAAVATRDQLRAAEQDARAATAAASVRLTNAAAVLPASIAACEAGHVELLT